MNDLGYTVKTLADISKEDIPEQHYLARIIRKQSAKDANGLESQGLFLPTVDVMEWMGNESIKEYLAGCIHDVQTKIARQVTDGGRNVVTDSDISVDAVAAYLEATDESIGRISKDKIIGWFNTELADALTLAFADKMGVSDTPTDAEAKKLEQVVTQYRDCFAVLAGKNSSVSPVVGGNLRKALDMIPASAFSIKVNGLLTKAMEQPTVDMLAL